ncbi:Choline transport-like protein [Cladobotryum mycophilum]|uniref:Choline transport-like protein n=1 Tax=Cladobotryum mycophilum TaxID=491253 RepID=A0ABR0T3P1_9HYPO
MSPMRDNFELGHLATVDPGRQFSDKAKRDYADGEQLARLGKKAVLRRTFGFISILGVSCTTLVTWEGVPINISLSMKNGGPAGLVYSFILVWIGNFSFCATLCELVSIAPTSAGQYHWVSMLAPRSSAKFLSYITGWLTVGGWQASLATIVYVSATMIQGVAVLLAPSYTIERYQSTLIMWAVILFSLFINSVVNRLLSKFEGLILVLHILGFFGIMIALVTLGPRADAASVFTTFRNDGNWPTQGLSFMIGTSITATSFLGADAAFHLSEEVSNPSLVVPRSIMLTLMINGGLGFAMMMAILFCMGDLQHALESPTGYPFIEVFHQATDSVAASAIMTAILIVLCCSASVGILASTSRVFWAFARDRGFPFWRTLSSVNPRTSVPLWAVSITSIISALIGLVVIGSKVAFSDITSLTLSCLYASYFICAVLLLYRRCTGGLRTAHSTTMSSGPTNTPGGELVWGPWHIPGVFGIINNAFACVFLLIIWFFCLWPPATPVNAAEMNYSVLMTGSMVIFSIVYYPIWGKRDYLGPVIEADL